MRRIVQVPINYKIIFMRTTPWFKKVGWVYVPIHGMGLLVTLLAVLFLVPIFRNLPFRHSVSDMLYYLFVYTTCTVFWWKWVAEKTS